MVLPDPAAQSLARLREEQEADALRDTCADYMAQRLSELRELLGDQEDLAAYLAWLRGPTSHAGQIEIRFLTTVLRRHICVHAWNRELGRFYTETHVSANPLEAPALQLVYDGEGHWDLANHNWLAAQAGGEVAGNEPPDTHSGGPDPTAWSPLLKDDLTGSYMRIRRGAFAAQAPQWEAQIQQLAALSRPTLRDGGHMRSKSVAWYTNRGCTCTRRYPGMPTTTSGSGVEPRPFPEWLTNIMRAVMPACGLSGPPHWPNSCELTTYANEEEGRELAADDADLFHGTEKPGMTITMVLGATRKFTWKLIKRKKGTKGRLQDTTLSAGDLHIMEGRMQAHYHFGVPRGNGQHAPQTWVVWRWIMKHSAECPHAMRRGE